MSLPFFQGAPRNNCYPLLLYSNGELQDLTLIMPPSFHLG